MVKQLGWGAYLGHDGSRMQVTGPESMDAYMFDRVWPGQIMAETLSAIVLVTSSAKGNSLVFWWPPSPSSSPKLRRARPPDSSWPSFLDNSWRASRPHGNVPDPSPNAPSYDISENYWSRPPRRKYSPEHDHGRHLSSSRKNSPSKTFGVERSSTGEQYDTLFGYSAEYLGNLLCPRMCHQKYELIVDDLVFVGHPVCADADDVWRFKSEKNTSNSRDRDSLSSHSPHDFELASSARPDKSLQGERHSYGDPAWLLTFHLVFILDLPEPSSSASGNVLRYLDIIYEQIAFVVTAVLFREQVQSNFVEAECDILGTLKESCISKGRFSKASIFFC